MPQLEDGYTRLANELLEAVIRHPFSKRQYKVVLAVVRRTYGFHRKEDLISLSQLSEMTGLSRAHCSETVNELVATGVFLKREHLNSQVIGINKKYVEWRCSQNRNMFPKQEQKCSQNGNKGVPKTGTTKERFKESTKEKGREPRQPVGIRRFIDDCKANDEKPIPEGDPVFAYAEEAGITKDALYLAWREFVVRNTESGKRYKDWRKAFRNCVRGNWYKIWYFTPEGDCMLTTTGRQAERVHKTEAA